MLLASLLCLAGLSPASGFLLMNQLLAYERIDPIVTPTGVSGHVHAVIGGNHFRYNQDFASANSATCSSMEIQENKSNYWAPSLFARNDNGTFTALPMTEARIYYMNTHPTGTKLFAFPQNFRMVVGDPNRRAPLDNDPAFIGYTPQSGGTNVTGESFPLWVSQDFLRLEMHFPQCWNGDLDSADHKSHVAFRTDDKCPATHPKPVAEINLEFGYRVDNYRADQLVLSTGDTTGYGLHGDYISFWQDGLLQKVLDDPTCQQRENIFDDQSQCNTLASLRNEAAMQACKLDADIPQEEVGIIRPILALPGCNPLWSASGPPKSSCATTPIPALGKPSSFYNFNRDYNPNRQPASLVPVYSGLNQANPPTANPPPTITAPVPSATSTAPKPATTATSTRSSTTNTKTTTTTQGALITATSTPAGTHRMLTVYNSVYSSVTAKAPGVTTGIVPAPTGSCLSFTKSYDGQFRFFNHNFRSAQVDSGDCTFFDSDNCDPSTQQWGLLAGQRIDSFGSYNAHWGSVRCR